MMLVLSSEAEEATEGEEDEEEGNRCRGCVGGRWRSKKGTEEDSARNIVDFVKGDSEMKRATMGCPKDEGSSSSVCSDEEGKEPVRGAVLGCGSAPRY